MTIEEALEYCTKEQVTVIFFSSHVEVTNGWYNATGVDFVDAVSDLKEMYE